MLFVIVLLLLLFCYIVAYLSFSLCSAEKDKLENFLVACLDIFDIKYLSGLQTGVQV